MPAGRTWVNRQTGEVLSPPTTSVVSNTTDNSNAKSAVALQEMVSSTTEMISNFPQLQSSVPNIINWCVNNWYAESTFRGSFSDGTSRGNTIVTGLGGSTDPDSQRWRAGRSLYTGYWTDSTIVTYRQTHGNMDPAILDGLYAHSTSQTMGAYFITGNTYYQSLFGLPKYNSIARSHELLVPVGTRVTSVFPDNVDGRKKGILAGLAVLDQKYNSFIGKPTIRYGNYLNAIGEPYKPGDTINSRQAVLLAFMAYVGLGQDANGYSGTTRALFVKGATTSNLQALSVRNIRIAGPTTNMPPAYSCN